MGDVELGTEYSESTLMKVINTELRKLTNYLSGKGNQGKAYASFSFKTGNNEEERWRIETVDLKYKEYISSLIEYDKRADEVILSSMGSTPPYRPFPRTVSYPRAALTSITTTSCTFLASLPMTKNAPPRSTMPLCLISGLIRPGLSFRLLSRNTLPSGGSIFK